MSNVRRSTLSLLSILLLLGGYIYWFERDPVSDTEESGELLFEVSEDDIVRLEVQQREGEALVLERRGDDGTFWLAEPVEARSTESDTDRLLENLATMRFARRVANLTEGAESNAEAYGLDPPALEVRFRTRDDRELGVRFGSDTPTGTNQYLARVGEGANGVLVASSYLSTPFQVTPWDLRLKTVFDTAESADAWDSEAVRLTVHRTESNDVVVIERRSGSWLLEAPVRARADQLRASKRLTSLRELEMQSLVSETATQNELIDCGLETPRYRVMAEVLDADESALPVLEIHIGVEKEIDVCARAPSRPQVFLIDSGFVEDLDSDLLDLVSRRLFHFVAGDANHIRIESLRDDTVREAEKVEEGWRVDGGDDDSREVSVSAVNELLYGLTGVHAEEVLAGPTERLVREESARWRVTVELEDDSKQSVTIVVPEPAGEENLVYGFRENEDLALAVAADAWSEVEALLALTPSTEEPS